MTWGEEVLFLYEIKVLLGDFETTWFETSISAKREKNKSMALLEL